MRKLESGSSSLRHVHLGVTLALLLLASLIACGRPTQAPAQPERVVYNLGDLSPQGSASGNGVTVTFEKTADWDAGSGNRGFSANVTVLNRTGQAIAPWDLQFDFLQAISQMWNATYTKSGNRHSVTPDGWNSRLLDGKSRSFGFNGVYSGVFQAPTAYVLSGIQVGPQAPPSPVTPACHLTPRFVVTSDWQNGDGTRGFVAEMYLTNTGSDPVNWRLTFDFAASISNIWNASFIRNSSGYTVTPDGWNVRLEPSQTRSFGFQGTYAGVLSEPQNIVCNGGGDSGGTLPPLTPEQEIFVNAFITLSLEERAQIGQAAYDLAAATPNATIESLNEFVIRETQEAASRAGLRTQEIPSLNVVEIIVSAEHPYFAALVALALLHERQQEARLFPVGFGQNPPRLDDAFRHAFWNVWMIELFHISLVYVDGASMSKLFTDAHECIYYGVPVQICEATTPKDKKIREMDLHNNAWAREWARTNLPQIPWWQRNAPNIADILAAIIRNPNQIDANCPVVIQEFPIGTAPNYAFNCSVVDVSTEWCLVPVGYDESNRPTPGPGDDPEDPGDPQPSDGSSWGDPHIFTLDGGFYTFMATGDYILSESTDPSDDFMVQVRYRPFSGPIWSNFNSGQWSANEAVALNIHGDIVEFYAVDDYAQPLALINGVAVPAGDAVIPLPGGGTVGLAGRRATASWRDGSSLFAELNTSAQGGWAIAGRVYLSLSKSRWRKVQGLLGNNDGAAHNDIRLRDGTRLPLDSSDHDEAEALTRALYEGPFRSSWLVQSYESLFSRGVNRFDPFYPSDLVSLDDFSPAVIAIAQQACGLEGVTSAAVLSRCVLDVANTGDDLFARLASAVDPQTPGVTISPQTVYLTAAEPRQLTAFVRGPLEDRRVVWSASAGSLSGSGETVSYTPPSAHGEYTVSAALMADPTVRATATVVVGEPLVIAPSSAIMRPNEQRSFAAFGADDRAVAWSASGGVISGSGRSITYTAPATPGAFALHATVSGFSTPLATAQVAVVSDSLTPTSTYLTPGQTRIFRWVGTEGLEVVWSASAGAITDDGAYTAPSALGEYALTASLASDPAVRVTASVRVVETISIGDRPTTMRLTWGAEPRDLDAHLWLPDSHPYHLYYASRGDSSQHPFATLDQDVVNGFGPETITIVQRYPTGTYHYAIYNYSGTGSFPTSGAQVEVYDAFGTLATYTPPQEGSGRWWHVLSIAGDTGAVTEVNHILSSFNPYAFGVSSLSGDSPEGMPEKQP